LQEQIDADNDQDLSNEDQTLTGTGQVVLSTTEAGDGGGTVTCADITGGAGLCDGNDAVDDADNDSSNELQTLSDNGGVTLSDGGGTVSCADITGGAGLCDGNDAVDDADNDSSNELQTLTKTILTGFAQDPGPNDTLVCPAGTIAAVAVVFNLFGETSFPSGNSFTCPDRFVDVATPCSLLCLGLTP